MSKKEIEKQLEEIEKLKRSVLASKQSALDFLVKAGICTKAGTLKKEYR